MTIDDAHTVRARLKYADALTTLRGRRDDAKLRLDQDPWDSYAYGLVVAYSHAIELLEN